MMAKDPLEPDAATSGTSGSEGAGSWQHDPATRLPTGSASASTRMSPP